MWGFKNTWLICCNSSHLALVPGVGRGSGHPRTRRDGHPRLCLLLCSTGPSGGGLGLCLAPTL